VRSVRLAALAAALALTASWTHAAISSSGSVTPSPPQTAGADPIIGVNDIGRFTITPSSVVNSDVATIGLQPTGIGFATVSGFDSGTGSGAVWNTNDMTVGSSGTGMLEVLNGAVVTIDFVGNPGAGDLSVGRFADSVGTVVVSGRGSILRIGDDTFIGHVGLGVSGSGHMIIADEGFVNATNDAATELDIFTVGTRGRLELDNGRLRSEFLTNVGAIAGNGRIDNEMTISNLPGGRFEVGPGDRMLINGGPGGGVGFDNDGEVNIVGGEIEFLEAFTNTNQAAKVTLRDGGVARFTRSGFGFDSTGGVLATTSGTNDIFGTVRIQGASSRIVVAGGSTAVFHDPVTNSGATIEVFPDSTAVFLQGLTTAFAAPALRVHVTDPGEQQDSGAVEVAGIANLDGDVQVAFAGGFAPRVGDQFTVLHASSISGGFSGASSNLAGIQLHPIHTATSASVLVAAPGDKTWGIDASGNSSLAGNWLGGVAPGAIDDKVAFTTVISAHRTVTVDSPFTAGSLYFDDNNTYLVQGPGAITLDVSSSDARIDVKNLHGNGLHTIAAPLNLNDDTVIDVAGSSTFQITSQITAGAGLSVIKSGNGTLAVKNIRAAKFSVAGGTVQVFPNAGDGGTSRVDSLDIVVGSQFDLTDNDLIIDHNGPPGTLVNETRQHLQSARLSSSLASTSTRLGYGDNAVLNKAGFSGQAVDPSTLLIKFTYAGDTDLDGDVDVADLGNLASHWQGTGVWTDGDSDYSGSIDVNDLGLLATNWQAGVGSPLGPSPGSALASLGLPSVAVPEPAMLYALLSTGLFPLTRPRRR
jgi:T5SS/PEP-CTERM-associated repeat protein